MRSRHNLYTACLAVILLVPGILAQLIGDEVWEYCEGEGSICETSMDMFSDCEEKSGSEYYKCICTSGYVRVWQACEWCKLSTGGSGLTRNTWEDTCKDEEYSIAPMPSSVSSAMAERNETLTEVPTATYTPTYTYITPTLTPWTTTLDNSRPDVTLPALPTEPVPTGAGATMLSRAALAWKCWLSVALTAMAVMVW